MSSTRPWRAATRRSVLAAAALAVTLALGCGGRSISELDAGATGGSDPHTSHTTGGGGSAAAAATGGFTSNGGAGGSSAGTTGGGSCGDGKVDGSLGEQCDDGNRLSGDGCSARCQLEAEPCSGLGAACAPPGCGDGTVDPNEQCDDGNPTGGDGCSARCEVEAGFACGSPGEPCRPICGDGKLVAREACDDGGTASGDGCSSLCFVEPGAVCSGEPSRCTFPVCGNALLEPGEECDLGTDNGRYRGDGTGCTTTCLWEPKCGRSSPGACATACGDGNVDPGEDCDDGNRRDDDGCSSDCRIEHGFTCHPVDVPDAFPCPSNGAYSCLEVPVTYRDFEGQDQPDGHPDFFYLGAPAAGGRDTGVVSGATATTCIPNGTGGDLAVLPGGKCPKTDDAPECPDLVAPSLGDDGKPVLTGDSCPCTFTDRYAAGVLDGVPGTETCTLPSGETAPYIDTTVRVIDSAASFAEWFAPSAASETIESWLDLALVTDTYAYRSSFQNAPAGAPGRTELDDIHDNCLGNSTLLASGFFPTEAAGGKKLCSLSAYYLYGGASSNAYCTVGAGSPELWEWDPHAAYDGCPNTGSGGPVPSSDGTGPELQGMLHNYYFTTEIHYLFRYSEPTSLSFRGNDDFWAFVNGERVVDLGGTHADARGSAWLDGREGLKPGERYEIAIFHANRHPPVSTFDLTLPASSDSRSVCSVTCGDGIRAGAEECDDGARNDGHYGGCTEDCHRASYCGDGVVDFAHGENCDGGPHCSQSCRVIDDR